MKKILILAAVAAAGLAASPVVFAQSCCAGGAAKMEGCSMGSSASAATSASPTAQKSKPVFAPAVQAAFDSYIQAQEFLAQDSFNKFHEAAADLSKAVKSGNNKNFSPKTIAQVEALAQAKDLESARASFKALSESLIAYVKDQKVPAGTYYEAYCPMAKASWLQTGTTIMNPYMGKSMEHCGQLKT